MANSRTRTLTEAASARQAAEETTLKTRGSIAYKGHRIHQNPLNGHIWITKGGFLVAVPSSINLAKLTVDSLTST